MTRFRSRNLALLLFAWGLSGCGDDSSSPSAQAPVITAPVIVSPPSGSSVSGEPTLTVANVNVSSGATPTYEFQVSVNSSYSPIAAQQSGIPHDRLGRTSWQVSPPLAAGDYFWRARAHVESTAGPFSEEGRFSASGGGSAGTILIQDPLTNGTTVGVRRGGEFVSGGWRINNMDENIRYEIPTTSNGYVEWENTGLRPMNAAPDAYMLFGMWDPSRGEYRTNPFRVNIQKLDTNHNSPYVRFRFISKGEEHRTGYDFLQWDPSRRYRWRVEWGPGVEWSVARVLLDGIDVMEVEYKPDYTPSTHWVELGVAQERGESCIGAIFSNVRIGRR